MPRCSTRQTAKKIDSENTTHYHLSWKSQHQPDRRQPAEIDRALAPASLSRASHAPTTGLLAMTGRFVLRSDSARHAAPLGRGSHCVALIGAVIFHAALIAALLQYAPARRSLGQALPIVVSPITPPAPVTPPPPKQSSPRKAALKEATRTAERVVEALPVVSESAPVAPITAAPPHPPQPAAPVMASGIAPDPPALFIPPRFNADYLQNPPPPYPALARRMREQGRVLIRVLVSVEGMPEQIELKASSGFPRLDQSALETVRSWKFVPAHQGDQRIAAWVLVPITFTLEG